MNEILEITVVSVELTRLNIWFGQIVSLVDKENIATGLGWTVMFWFIELEHPAAETVKATL